LAKLASGQAAATVLALAGLKRLSAAHHARHVFTTDEMLPAVAQGAIGVEMRTFDTKTRALFEAANHSDTEIAVTLERAFLEALDGSCKTPLAGLATFAPDRTLSFSGCVLSPDGKRRHDVARKAKIANTAEARTLGLDAGHDLIARAGRHFFDV
jgi:hydroxymethylbilane synthase